MAPTDVTATTATPNAQALLFQEQEETNDPSFRQRIKCPCDNFTALSKIVEILDSEDSSSSSSMQSLVDWLDGRTDQHALNENKLLSCGKRSRCRFRYGTSFAILNAIRDACRPHLESAWNGDSSSSGNASSVVVEEGFSKQTSKGGALQVTPIMPYEEAFPSLKSSKANSGEVKPHPAAYNILVPRKKLAPTKVVGTQEQPKTLVPKKKNKRRIRPAQVTEPVDRGPTNSVWNMQASTNNQNSTNSWGNLTGSNLANMPSRDPLPAVKASVETAPVVETPVKVAPASPKVAPPASPIAMTAPQNKTDIAVAVTPTTNGQMDAVPVKKALPHQLENLVTIFIALFRNMLVPSTPLELHLLIRLLVLEGDMHSGNASSSDGSTMDSFFRPMFTDYESCQRFAVLALTKLKPILQRLPIPLLQSLLRCEPFQRHCADVAQDLNVLLEEYSRQGLLVEFPTENVTGTHAILSLPFEKERDSRHNYKTQAEVAVYKNREESRDAFLGELRVFMSVKGRVFRPQDMERAQERVRQESKGIMNGLLSVNMMWFAQFFCELLLQVGLAPVQETDQELLNIADRDKLQKLHKRFSSRSTHTGKSSKKISMSQRSNANSTTPIDEARLLFPGYQEFFFIFLHQLPFNFGFHLRGRMTKTILELFSKISPDGLELHIMKLQLIARFLGFLIFSPNWHEAGIDSSKIQAIALADGLQQLQSLGLSPIDQIEQAWGKGQLIATVPWMTELLRMAKWDSLTQTSREFRKLLAYLRGVQTAIVWLDESTGASGRFGPSMELVSFYLERFFDETSGLPRLTSLPHSIMGSPDEDLIDCLDKTNSGFSSIIIFSSSPHMEDLFSLVDQIERGLVSKVNKSPSKARKLRPSVVSRNIGMEPSKLFGEAEKGLLPTPVKARNRSNDESMDNLQKEQRSIETRLVEAFFHQHRDVKGICDFAVNQVLKSAPSQIMIECIEPIFENEGITNDSSEEKLANTQTLVFNKAKSSLETRLNDTIKSALEIFCPNVLHHQIASIAISLSVTRGMLSGQPVLHTLVSNVSKTAQRSKGNEPQVKPAVAKDTVNKDNTSMAVSALEDIMHAFDGAKSEESALKAEDVLVLVRRASSLVEITGMAFERDGSVPAESSLRAFVASLLQLDRSCISILNWCQTLPDKEFHSVTFALLSLILAVASVSSYGLKQFVCMIDSGMILRLVETSIDEEGRIRVTLLLEAMVDANILEFDLLPQSLGI